MIIDPTTQEIYGDRLFNSVIVIEGTIIEVEAQSNEGYEFTVGHPVSDNSRVHKIH